MQKKWLILTIIVLIYLPVTIDATVMHVATPSLSAALNLTANQLLWIIDIYSLIMAGLILPMGALGDRIGFKKLLFIGTAIFGVGSLAAAFSPTAYALIASRAVLGLGAAMLIPATLSGIRNAFTEEKQRNFALGLWSTVGGGGAAFGPLVGGFVLEHFHWGAVFLINIPIILVVLVMIVMIILKQQEKTDQPINLGQALILVVAILSLIYSIKSAMYNFSVLTVVMFVIGISTLIHFIQSQKRSTTPMIDLELFKHPVISTSIVMAVVSMIALVGFELLLSQELQFVHGFSPLQAAMFIIPFMIAISLGGPLAGICLNKWGLAQLNFSTDHFLAWTCMVFLGFSIEIALLASTAAIMSSVPPQKASAAGAIEGMAYELGAGLGVAIFGLMLSWFYSRSIILPEQLPTDLIEKASISIGETMQLASSLENPLGGQLVAVAQQAFSYAHSWVLTISAICFFLLTVFVWFSFPKKVN
ncbi:MFS transporter [Acinetobacter baumannii]